MGGIRRYTFGPLDHYNGWFRERTCEGISNANIEINLPLFSMQVVCYVSLQLMLPRVIVMYGLCLIAFVIYAAKVPERWLTGKVDFVGHSHNWWHLFILAAFYHWHNTGLVYADYRLHHGCHGPILT